MRTLTVIVIMLTVFPSLSFSISPEEVNSLKAKLESWDVEEVWPQVETYLTREPKDPQLLELASHIAFHRGEYREALKLMKSVLEGEGEEERRKAFALFIEQTIGVVTPFKSYVSPHFIITLDEKQDGFLIGYIIDALENTCRLMAEHYGFTPREKVRVEIFPDARAFYFASSLSARDIEIGAVGLAKFNKLMLLSPAALIHGYRWLDAISHEYMHYLVVKMTANKAPIWFHEGLAKYEETRWRNGPSYLSSFSQTLLARALADGKLIRFEKMEPSLIRLETPEEVQLAYAQTASAIEFIITQTGMGGLKRIMDQMALQNDRGAKEPIKNVLGLAFEEFEENWRRYLASQGLKEVSKVQMRRFKIKERMADEERMDMEEIKSLVARNRAHLADLLRGRGRINAAILEYQRALTETPDSVPILNKLSSTLLNIERDEEVLPLLNRAKEVSPDHPATYTNLGKTYLRLKDFKRAREAFQESIQINPFDPEAHQGLAQAYEILGEKVLALQEREIARKLSQ